jgi:hypothetical protein
MVEVISRETEAAMKVEVEVTAVAKERKFN